MKRLAPVLLLALVAGCRGGAMDFAPPTDERIFETLLVLRVPSGDSDPEGEMLPDGRLDRTAPLSEAERTQIAWVFDSLAQGGEMGPAQMHAITYLRRFGSRAFPEVEARTQDPSPDVRVVAAYLLYYYGRRSMPALREMSRDPDPSVRLDATTALARLGDRESIGVLVDLLEDPDPGARGIAILALYVISGEDYGFGPDLPERERAEAVARWREWYHALPRTPE